MEGQLVPHLEAPAVDLLHVVVVGHQDIGPGHQLVIVGAALLQVLADGADLLLGHQPGHVIVVILTLGGDVIGEAEVLQLLDRLHPVQGQDLLHHGLVHRLVGLEAADAVVLQLDGRLGVVDMGLRVLKIDLAGVGVPVEGGHVGGRRHEQDAPQGQGEHGDGGLLPVLSKVHHPQPHRGEVPAQLTAGCRLHAVLGLVPQGLHGGDRRRQFGRLVDREQGDDVDHHKHPHRQEQGIEDAEPRRQEEIPHHTADHDPQGGGPQKEHPPLSGDQLPHLLFGHADGAQLTELMDPANDGEVEHPIDHQHRRQQDHRPHQAVEENLLAVHRQGVQEGPGGVHKLPLHPGIAADEEHGLLAVPLVHGGGPVELGIDLIGLPRQLAARLGVGLGEEEGELAGVLSPCQQAGDGKGLRIAVVEGEGHLGAQGGRQAHPLQHGPLDGHLVGRLGEAPLGEGAHLDVVGHLADVVGHHRKTVQLRGHPGFHLDLVGDPLVPLQGLHLGLGEVIVAHLLGVGEVPLGLLLLPYGKHQDAHEQGRGQDDGEHHKPVAHPAGPQAGLGHAGNHVPFQFLHGAPLLTGGSSRPRCGPGHRPWLQSRGCG